LQEQSERGRGLQRDKGIKELKDEEGLDKPQTVEEG